MLSSCFLKDFSVFLVSPFSTTSAMPHLPGVWLLLPPHHWCCSHRSLHIFLIQWPHLCPHLFFFQLRSNSHLDKVNLRYADDTTLMAESEGELKSLLKVKVESEKVGLKLNIQKTKIMASGPITSWEVDGETVADFYFLGSKITTDDDCSHEIKRRLLLWRKVMTNLDSIFKSRDMILPTQVCLVKAMVFPVVMYGCESWMVKKAEHQRIDGLVGSLWPPDGEELAHWKRPWCWERLQEGGERDDRGWDGCMASQTQWTWVWVNSGSWWWTWRPGMLQYMGSQRIGHDWATEVKGWLEWSIWK